MGNLHYKNYDFYLSENNDINTPFKIISGSIHYFRTVPEYWEDRLKKLKACGFNTVETYMCWNLHEETEGNFNFEGILDIEKFIDIANSLDLKVIVRPGPYICAEWEMGGLPSWLLSYHNMRLRCFYQPYLDKVRAFYTEVMRRLVPLLSTNGGPIIAMQVENEYGSFGNDKKYLQYIKDLMIELGVDVKLFTSDGDCDWMLNGGTLPDVYKIANFGSRTEHAFKQLEKHQPNAPYMCGEFWNGWFDHWSEKHHTTNPQDVAKELETMLSLGGNVNFYMFHGGTNFNFYNGSNYDKVLQPTVTSYDDDALLSENGDLTPKYFAVKEVLAQHGCEVDTISVSNIQTMSYGNVTLSKCAKLFDNLSNLSSPVLQSYTSTMEELGQQFGFILYRTYLTYEQEERELFIDDVHDRALVYVNGEFVGLKDRTGLTKEDTIKIGVNEGQTVCLDIFVENLGRVNYGPEIIDFKGITQQARLGLQTIHGWEIYQLPMKDLSNLAYTDACDTITMGAPCFLKGTINIDTPNDTFLRFDNLVKGVVYVNGYNIGRYWNVGPTKTMYIPAPLLKQGENTIEVFELHGTKNPEISLVDTISL